eukprot:sb/3469265/
MSSSLGPRNGCCRGKDPNIGGELLRHGLGQASSGELSVEVSFKITDAEVQSMQYYRIRTNFTNIAGNGTYIGDPTLIVAQRSKLPKLLFLGLIGLDAPVLCEGYTVIKPSYAWLLKDGKGDEIGKVSSTSWDEDKATATFNPAVSKTTVDSVGNYKCVIKFSNDEVMSEEAAYLKLLYIEGQPDVAFAGQKGTTATVTAYVSFPEDETGSVEVEEPKIDWMKVRSVVVFISTDEC